MPILVPKGLMMLLLLLLLALALGSTAAAFRRTSPS